jgi:hypothetical protein
MHASTQVVAVASSLLWEVKTMEKECRSQLDLPDLNQVGFVVRNMDQALALYEPLFGPFSCMEPGPMIYDYRGVQEECAMRLAFVKSGDVKIELIEWVSGGCPYKEFLDAGREGGNASPAIYCR